MTPLLVLIGETLGVSLVTALRLSLVKHPLVSPINTLRVVSDSKNTSYSPRATKRTKTILLVKCFLSLWKEIGFAQSRETDSKLMLGYHPLSSDLASFFASSNTLYDTPAISGRYFSPSLMSTDIHFGGSYKLLLDKLLQYVLESGTIRRRCCAFSCWELGSSIQSAERR